MARRLAVPLVVLLCVRALVFGASVHAIGSSLESSQQVLDLESQPSYPKPSTASRDAIWDANTVRNHLENALHTMQNEFFEVWIGQWPDSIDWTGAVLGTHLAATLSALSRFSEHETSVDNDFCSHDYAVFEDHISRYFAQLQAYYFGQDAFAIRLQAHDDMQWVILGWLEALKFIQGHDDRHHLGNSSVEQGRRHRWHGTLFTPAFAHRSHVFYNITSNAWDNTTCGGGVNWNPNLEPYKNAVTNEQYVSAAIGMYLYHPGDRNRSPILDSAGRHQTSDTTHRRQTKPGADANNDEDNDLTPARPHDPANLLTAKQSYRWLSTSNMTNTAGLYTDGFHVRKHPNPHTGVRACDLRNEMVYTYNQGIILSGLRQLWEATGQLHYLTDGHDLVRAVIKATGYDSNERGWKGLGYNGILTEYCDPRGTCSQDAQTFKGIFFHHLAAFCEPLPVVGVDEPLLPGRTYLADRGTAGLHASSCGGYLGWVGRNARAAWGTRDKRGVMGEWWGAPKIHRQVDGEIDDEEVDVALPELPVGAVDWRNEEQQDWEDVMTEGEPGSRGWDFNDRGRGRTVESHSGGLAVLRALYAFMKFYG